MRCRQLAALPMLIFQAGGHSRDVGCTTFLRQLWQCVASSLPHQLFCILRAGSRSRDADCITSLHQLWQCVAGSLPHILISILQAGSHSRDAGWITFSANCAMRCRQLPHRPCCILQAGGHIHDAGSITFLHQLWCAPQAACRTHSYQSPRLQGVCCLQWLLPQTCHLNG